MAMYRYVVKNLDKYMGDARRVTARSKWELMYMQALDNSLMVRKWTSEPKNLNIAYISPLDKKIHQYWPDFLVQYNDGSIEILEIKPLKEALAEKTQSTQDKIALIKNIAKWKAADIFAQRIGAKFRVITEKSLFQKKSTNKPRRPKTTTKPRGTVK